MLKNRNDFAFVKLINRDLLIKSLVKKINNNLYLKKNSY